MPCNKNLEIEAYLLQDKEIPELKAVRLAANYDHSCVPTTADVSPLVKQQKLDDALEALTLCVASLDQLLPYLGKVPADVGLLNDALMAARPLLEVKP